MNTKFIKVLLEGLKKVENTLIEMKKLFKTTRKGIYKNLKSPFEYNIPIENHCNVYR